jgi:pyruvate/2-oxoglutarate dehydrogenase complex dihydrolipoamide acyltransferase (E2) component
VRNGSAFRRHAAFGVIYPPQVALIGFGEAAQRP